VETSERAGDIRQSDEVGEAMLALRRFMFEHVYLAEPARLQHVHAHETVRRIFDHLAGRGDSAGEIVDYLSGMTDRFALDFSERV
jgi:dGTPase